MPSDAALVSVANSDGGDRMMKPLFHAMSIAVFVGACALVASTASASAFPPCPAIGFANGCNLIITITNGGSGPIANMALGDPNAYDGVEDQLVGVVNNSTSNVFNLGLTGSNIFGFESDGAGMPGTGCLSAGGNPFPCFAGGSFGPTGYEGPGTSFTVQNVNTGIVNFTGFLAPGATAWFSLEQPASLNGVTGTVNATVPEPASMFLLGTGVLGLAARLRRRRSA
jgi:hypothetical protein